MIEAIRLHVRYDTPDEKGETRRERNERFDQPSPPPVIVNPAVQHIWDWYTDLSNSIRRVRDGVCEPVPPSEFQAWRAATGNVVYPREYATLRAMDRAYCAEMNKELADFHERQRAAQEEAAKSQGRKGRKR